jgi:hypothetical protein
MNTSSNGGGHSRRISSAAGSQARLKIPNSESAVRNVVPEGTGAFLPDINQDSSKNSRSRPGSARISARDIKGTPKGSIMQKSLKSFQLAEALQADQIIQSQKEKNIDDFEARDVNLDKGQIGSQLSQT